MNQSGKDKKGPSGKLGLADMVGVSQSDTDSQIVAGAIQPLDVIKTALWPAIPFIVLHWQLLDWLVQSWGRNVNWSHGMLIPLFSVYLVYARWDDIKLCSHRISWVGLAVMILGLLLEVLFQVGPLRNFWMYGLAMVTTLFGLVLFLTGWGMLRYLWLPVIYLALSVPMPGSLYTQLAYPLQELAASGAVGFFKLCGVEITRLASKLTLVSSSGYVHGLTVAEACSGMHLLMAFFALGVAMAYLADRPVWQRVVLVLSGIPIAVFCNVLRVIITCFMYYIDKEELAQGVLHNFTGMLMLIPAFAMLWGLGWLLSKIFVDSESDEDEADDSDEAETEVGA